MRPGQNKRMRGRNNNNNGGNRRGPNPLTRSYESNGPDVKIRGTAHHVGEKYLQLARDAQSSGDPVMAESYLQHAEHYFRLIAAAQQAQQQAQFGYQRQPGDQIDGDDDADEDFESLPDRFASPSERAAVAPPAQPQAQPYEARQQQNDRQPYEQRGNGQHAGNGQYADRSQQDRGGDRQNDNRPRGDRPSYADRQDRNNGQDRGNGERNTQDRAFQAPPGQERGAASGNASRDYDNRNFRNRRDDRQNRDYGQGRDNGQTRDFREASREPRQPVPDEQPSVGLPAFITAPTRVVPQDVATAEQPSVNEAAVPQSDGGEEASFHMRPRRRRRPKAEFAGAETSETAASQASAPAEPSDD